MEAESSMIDGTPQPTTLPILGPINELCFFYQKTTKRIIAYISLLNEILDGKACTLIS
jgi:hypothetical protein